MVLNDESDMDSSNKISFLNKNPFYDLIHPFHEGNRAHVTLQFSIIREISRNGRLIHSINN